MRTHMATASQAMDTIGQFNPDRIAELEAAGWRAYYARNWPRVFGLMVQLNREQFRMSRFTAVAGATDIVCASIAFAPLDNDVAATTSHLRRFYEKARRARRLQADAATLAKLEMQYWVVHRRLAIERKQVSDHTGDIGPMVVALANLHAQIFTGSQEAIQQSAEWRARAAVTVDRITGGYTNSIEDDWRQVEAYLRRAYRSLEPSPIPGNRIDIS